MSVNDLRTAKQGLTKLLHDLHLDFEIKQNSDSEFVAQGDISIKGLCDSIYTYISYDTVGFCYVSFTFDHIEKNLQTLKLANEFNKESMCGLKVSLGDYLSVVYSNTCPVYDIQVERYVRNVFDHILDDDIIKLLLPLVQLTTD